MHKIGEGKKDERMRGMGGTSGRARGPWRDTRGHGDHNVEGTRTVSDTLLYLG